MLISNSFISCTCPVSSMALQSSDVVRERERENDDDDDDDDGNDNDDECDM
jgi:hypothetical protein